MVGWEFWLAAVIAASLVGAGKGGVPIVGMLGVPVLSLVIPPGVAAGLLLPVYIISDMFGLWAYRRDYNGRVLAIVLPGAVLGIAFGWATASLVPEPAVRVIVGGIGVSFALNLLLRKGVVAQARAAKVGPGLFWGAMTGFTSFVSHAGAPPWQVYTLPLGMTRIVFAGTSTIAFAVINLVKLPPYIALGLVNFSSLKLALLLAIPASIAVFLGMRLVKILPERLFFQLVTWALLAISIRLIWDGARALL
ncbi:sulfite exporter TauE/SafE family protein [Xinfangfangia sp. CPCC 101601]|uniref:Probable membrane transporter protein n=1 Tax=Pseudogemmobacter lacusdianii TaxID=3069608 RepID=A0ABU0VWN9_9RHOB|nr:sulfite exporter TauE/SafE family protein [Xinfangfangia sp. CPCC 101601]MDQ2066167.1 sulfite exporter TauE/SafE family protein [Xinfangfangia sp. CPCC 101601]